MSKLQTKQIEFHQHPYLQTDKFEIYIPKQSDKIMQLIERERQKPSNFSYLSIEAPKTTQHTHGDSKSSFKDKLINEIQDNRQQEAQSQPQPQIETQSQLQEPLIRSGSMTQNNRKNSQFVRYTQMQKSMERMRSKLYFDEKTMSIPKTTLKNKIIENIVQDSQVFQKKPKLMSSVYKLKQLNLLKQHEIHVNRYPGVAKFNFVYNDFHSKSTNPGFSRNDTGGGFYTR